MKTIRIVVSTVDGRQWVSDEIEVEEVDSVTHLLESISKLDCLLITKDGIETYFNPRNVVAAWFESGPESYVFVG